MIVKVGRGGLDPGVGWVQGSGWVQGPEWAWGAGWVQKDQTPDRAALCMLLLERTSGEGHQPCENFLSVFLNLPSPNGS